MDIRSAPKRSAIDVAEMLLEWPRQRPALDLQRHSSREALTARLQGIHRAREQPCVARVEVRIEQRGLSLWTALHQRNAVIEHLPGPVDRLGQDSDLLGGSIFDDGRGLVLQSGCIQKRGLACANRPKAFHLLLIGTESGQLLFL